MLDFTSGNKFHQCCCYLCQFDRLLVVIWRVCASVKSCNGIVLARLLHSGLVGAPVNLWSGAFSFNWCRPRINRNPREYIHKSHFWSPLDSQGREPGKRWALRRGQMGHAEKDADPPTRRPRCIHSHLRGLTKYMNFISFQQDCERLHVGKDPIAGNTAVKLSL
jgi:hypothetical protein